MIVKKTKILGVFILEFELREDSRGYFGRVFAREVLNQNDIKFDIVHINRSLTKTEGTIRGIHYQIKPAEEDKIIQCLKGKIFDVAVDLRRNSKTYGKWVGEELSEENKKMLLVPKGCGHAFQALENNCLIEYFVSEYYSPENERGIRFDDPFFRIKWPIKKAIVSAKDASWPDFKK